jgi:sporulation protein YunB
MYGPRFKLIPAIAISLIIILLVSAIFIDLRVKKSLLVLATADVQLKGTQIINNIINEKVVSKINYDDIVKVKTDKEGKIALIQPNTIILNQIMSTTVVEIADSLNHLSDSAIEIPFGQMLGIDLLAAYGPRMKVNVIPAGQAHVRVINKFEQAGINQTRHLIYFEIKSNIKIAVPLMKKDVEIVATVPMAETIIVGDVPQTYVNFKGSSEMVYPLIKE